MLAGERRTLPGESPGDVEQELHALLERTAPGAELRLGVTREPFEVAEEEEIVALVRSHAGADVIGVPFWTDAALLAAAGIPTVVFGPAGEGAHASEEWVELSSVERCAEVLLAVAADFCS